LTTPEFVNYASRILSKQFPEALFSNVILIFV